MKTKKLKFVGEPRLKVQLTFDFDEVEVTLHYNGSPTKYTDTLVFQRTNFEEDSDSETNLIGESILRLYNEFLKGRAMEEYLILKYLDMEYIEYEIGTKPPENEAYS